jgi:lycopene beta-cyclase
LPCTFLFYLMLKYDFIILGSGAAGLSLLTRMLESAHLNNKRILLIDKDAKNKNDRTWCFWENKKGSFEEVVYKTWDRLSFYGSEFSRDLNIFPYQYKMIRAIDFYDHCFSRINRAPNIDIIYGEVRSVVTDQKKITVHLADQELHCAPAIVFNSIYRPSDLSHGKLQLLQHFKGWVIESGGPSFNEDQATLMDFRVHQRYGTSFVYVLPISHTSALVEYTLFTPETLDTEQYNNELRDYIEHFLKLKDFTIKEEEFGVIPMTNERFRFFENGMYNIGIAGGQTKASTGYTFQFIQKQSQLIVDFLVHRKPLSAIPVTSKRFHFYDHVLLQLLISKQLGGKEIFTRMFKRNKASCIFKFLDNETSLTEELQLIASLQTIPFFKAALRVFNL